MQAPARPTATLTKWRPRQGWPDSHLGLHFASTTRRSAISRTRWPCFESYGRRCRGRLRGLLVGHGGNREPDRHPAGEAEQRPHQTSSPSARYTGAPSSSSTSARCRSAASRFAGFWTRTTSMSGGPRSDQAHPVPVRRVAVQPRPGILRPGEADCPCPRARVAVYRRLDHPTPALMRRSPTGPTLWSTRSPRR